MDLPAHIIRQASQKNLAEFIQFIAEAVETAGFGEERLNEIKIAVEEALVNIFTYAYPEKTGKAIVACRKEHNRQFVIEIIDEGEPFDFDSIETPDVKADIDDRQIGGLGILLIKELMDSVDYRREPGRNILQLTVKRP